MLNFIEYSVSCNFLFESPIEFSLDDLNVILTSKSQVLLIRFECSGEVEESSFEGRVLLELEKILDKISFSHSVAIGDYFEVSRSIGAHRTISNKMTGVITIVKPPLTDEQMVQLKQDLETNIHNLELFKMFRLALKNNNPIEQFVFLYGVIYLIYGNQIRVDNFIKSRPGYDPSEEKNSGNPRRDDKETIFTWLRNQIAHIDRTTDIKNVRTQILNKLSAFQIIVKEAISTTI